MVSGVAMALSAQQFLAQARRDTGIDVADDEALQPLSVLLESFNRESALHASGALGMQNKLLRILRNRLRMRRDFARHPEIADQKITAPIFICGMGRTGSTKTQKLLAASGDFNWLTYWKAQNPALFTGLRSESPQARIDDTEGFARWFDAASPETKAGHAFQTHEPEEESFILEHSLKSPVFLGWAPIPSYLNWLMAEDMSTQFLRLRDTLQYLQWQGLADANRRWILKSPLYSGMEPLLLKVFPDACLLMTHRSPVASIPSGLRLLECFYKPFTDAQPDANFYAIGQAAAMRQHLLNRAALKNNAFLDIYFAELMAAPERIIDKVYAFSDVELTAVSRQRMLDWNTNNPQHKLGKHEYSLASYGLTAKAIEDMFSDYVAFLKATQPVSDRA
jgi:Sulfotransferase family